MDYEFAVEPEAIASSWENFRFVMSLFGYSEGRLISQFPNKWFREVYQRASELSEVELSRIEVGLRSAKDEYKVMKFSRPYNSDKNWVDNVIFEHQRNPFGGVIISNKVESTTSGVFSIEELEKNKISVANQISANVDSIVGALHSLLRFGDQIEFVDPYLRIDRGKEDSSSRLLIKRCLETIKEFGRCSKIVIHYKDQKRMPTIRHIKYRMTGISDFVPDGTQLELYRWEEKADCPIEFHGRHLLTDKGGIFFDGGFGRNEDNRKYTLTRWSSGESLERMSAFLRNELNQGHKLVEKGLRIYHAKEPGLIDRLVS
ncbi:MAG: hypothetical protein OXG90_11790 [Gammaproteobacteria bacterium]|nr:hypothetical protein [Gammaproteobacteria bacterium]